MARVKVEIPKSFHYSVRIPVRITDLNYGGHLGNDSLLSLMHESRVAFLRSLGYAEMNLEGVGLIMSDVAVQYKAEAFGGDELNFELAVTDISMTAFDIVYYITRVGDNKVIAIAKTNMVCFDYDSRKMKEVPEKFASKFT